MEHHDVGPLTDPVADGLYHRLDPRAITVGRISAAVTATVIAVASLWFVLGAIVAALLDRSSPFWLVALGLPAWLLQSTLLGLAAYRLPALSYRYTSYCVDQKGIEIRRGIFWRRVINVPRTRVQHLDVSQGPLERRYGLGTLAIHTAGTQYAKVELGGLEHSRALRIREQLLPTGAAGDAV